MKFDFPRVYNYFQKIQFRMELHLTEIAKKKKKNCDSLLGFYCNY